MVNVFVIGAGGYLGNAIAIAARRSGHKVWGLVRKSEQAEQLKLNEIIPVIGDVSNPSSYESIYGLVSCIIDSTGFASGESGKILHDSIFAYAEKSPNKITFINTSGILVYGKQAEGTIIDEDTRINPSFIFGGLVATEERIIKSDKLNGVVIRPGGVFGGTGGHFLDDFWGYDSKTGDYEFKGNADKQWGFIHVIDLAELYVKILEAPSSTIAHQIFNAVNDAPNKVIDIRTAMAKAAGATGKLIQVPAGADPFSQEREHSMIISNKKAKRLLGWAPKFDFLADMPLYYQGWKGANPSK